MTPEAFLAEFGHFADAPNGVQKLRELILQLAVQGKLVPQDPGDEPASILAERIRASKDQLALRGARGNRKTRPPLQMTEQPYLLPPNWEWQRLEDVFSAISVGSNKVKTKDILETGSFPVVDQGQSYIAGFTEDEEKLISIPGPVVIFGDHTRALKYIDFDFVAGADGVKILRPMEVLEPYFFRALQSFQLEGRGYGRHYSILLSKHFPLPPLAEQKRIVAKVDQLMALCDELEARKQQRREARVRLNNAALDALLNATDPDDFAAHWQRIGDHFDLLYDHPETIAKLRAAILQLAVQGKLVPQDPGDEPAVTLLAEISLEKERQLAAKLRRKEKPLPVLAEEILPFAVPRSWEWTRLGAVSDSVEYGTSQKAHEISRGVPVLRMGNIAGGKIAYDNLKFVDEDIDDLPRLFLNSGDILFNRTNSAELVGKAAVYDETDGAYTFASYLIRVSVFSDFVAPHFVNIALGSSYFRTTQIEPELTQQCGQANFNGTKLKSSLLPLPPLAEQKRIVAKVDHLMALCDGLEANLTQAQEQSEKLMEATVRHFVGQAPKPAPAGASRTPRRAGLAPPKPAEPATDPRPNGNIPQAILGHMQPGTAYSRADILDALGMSTGDWNWAIQQLKEAGKVAQTGQRRGARYVLTGP